MSWYGRIKLAQQESVICHWLSENPIDLRDLKRKSQLPENGFDIINHDDGTFSILFKPLKTILVHKEPSPYYAIMRLLAFLSFYKERCFV